MAEIRTKKGQPYMLFLRPRLKKRLEKEYGAVPDIHYFPEDMNNIKTYFDYCRNHNPDDFYLDDITWRDLKMDDIYKRINVGLSTSGEQYLYFMLRQPTVEKSKYEQRLKQIQFIESNSALRLKLQIIFSKLGRNRLADVCQAFYPTETSTRALWLYLLLMASLIISALGFFITPQAMFFLFAFVGLNTFIHTIKKAKLERNLATVNYTVAMVFAAQKIRKLSNPALAELLAPMYNSLEALRGLLRMGGVSAGSPGSIADMLNSLLLLDLIAYEYSKNKIGRCHKDIFVIHEYLGMLNSAIAVASYRKSLTSYANPQIDFTLDRTVNLSLMEFRHPLMPAPVSNSIDLKKSALITGSNASGKSTFLKTVAINVIFAQSICTALCRSYEATAFHLFSSMTVTDDLSLGDSYYVAEIKSLKRIIDFSQSGKKVLCLVDEVLRGTNTIERIAASSEILSGMAKLNLICIAATHDIELCRLLNNEFAMYHFQEQIRGEEMSFDYKLREGPATSRNALKLLKIIGLNNALVSRAENRASKYLETGVWDMGI